MPMTRKSLLIQKIKSDEKSIWLTKLSSQIWVSRSSLWSISKNRKEKYRKQTLDILYHHYWLKKDDWYLENLKKRNPPTFSVIWNILRLCRIQKGMTMRDVAIEIRWEERAIARIEAGDRLPAYKSWYMSELLRLYSDVLTEKDLERIRRWCVILWDLVKTMKKLDPDSEAMKKLGFE